MFYRRRQELQRVAEAEAEGASFWSPDFRADTRVRIGYALGDAMKEGSRGELLDQARSALLRDEGWTSLQVGNTIYNGLVDFVRVAPDSYVASAIEAVYVAGEKINNYVRSIGGKNDPFDRAHYSTQLNEIFARDRVSFELIDGQMVPFESRELHVEVVQPTLRLLAGVPALAGAEAAYRDALAQLAHGGPDNAITDAARALEETLLALGAKGNALGPLLADARKHGLLAAHDKTLADGIAKFIDWVSADRAARGDAHAKSSAGRDDAWLAVHVVGALILRLSRGGRDAGGT